VVVINEEAGPEVVAAIELVSPGNKDRPESRTAFAIKCVACLQQSICVAVIDVVSSRLANLHDEIMRLMNVVDGVKLSAGGLWAATYRTRHADDEGALDVWWEPLAIGQSLPTLPLWLNLREAVPVRVGESYETACRSLRIEGMKLVQ
jgi:hypothetical protein